MTCGGEAEQHGRAAVRAMPSSPTKKLPHTLLWSTHPSRSPLLSLPLVTFLAHSCRALKACARRVSPFPEARPLRCAGLDATCSCGGVHAPPPHRIILRLLLFTAVVRAAAAVRAGAAKGAPCAARPASSPATPPRCCCRAWLGQQRGLGARMVAQEAARGHGQATPSLGSGGGGGPQPRLHLHSHPPRLGPRATNGALLHLCWPRPRSLPTPLRPRRCCCCLAWHLQPHRQQCIGTHCWHAEACRRVQTRTSGAKAAAMKASRGSSSSSAAAPPASGAPPWVKAPAPVQQRGVVALCSWTKLAHYWAAPPTPQSQPPHLALLAACCPPLLPCDAHFQP